MEDKMVDHGTYAVRKLHPIQVFRRKLSKHSDKIWLGVGIVGFFGTVALAVIGTTKAMPEVEAKKKELKKEKLTPTETIQATWKCYIPAAVTGALSTAAVVGSNHISAKRNAALATAYALSDSMLHEYRKRVVEKLGEKKEQEVRDDIDREAVEKNPPSNDIIVMSENCSGTLCYDAGFGRYFHSDIETIRRAVNRLNHDMMNGFYGYTSLNDFYREIDSPELPPIEQGDNLGWNMERGLIEVDFSTQLAWGRVPCLVMRYTLCPEYNYF